MLTDRNVLFFENAAGPEAEGALELNGPAKGKIFIAVAADPADGVVKVTDLDINISTSETATVNSETKKLELTTPEVIATLKADKKELEKGVVSFHVPHNVMKFVKLEVTVSAGSASKVETDARTGRKTGGLTAGYVPITEEDGYIAPDMLALIK